MPQGRVADILPSRAAAGRDGQASPEAPAPAPAVTSPPTPAEAPPVARRYLNDGLLPRTAAHPELLRADGVLDEVVKRLESRGLLRRRSGDGAGPADPLRRSLEAVFASEALVARLGSLLGNGVWVWFPAKGFAGATEYVWVRVSVERVEPAHAHQHRPEVKLTLRGESLEEHKTSQKRGNTLGGGGVFTLRGGDHDSESGQQGHVGVDYAAGTSPPRSRRGRNWRRRSPFCERTPVTARTRSSTSWPSASRRAPRANCRRPRPPWYGASTC